MWHYILAQSFACNETHCSTSSHPHPFSHLSLAFTHTLTLSLSIYLASTSLYDSRKLQMVSISCYTIARKCSRHAQ